MNLLVDQGLSRHHHRHDQPPASATIGKSAARARALAASQEFDLLLRDTFTETRSRDPLEHDAAVMGVVLHGPGASLCVVSLLLEVVELTPFSFEDTLQSACFLAAGQIR